MTKHTRKMSLKAHPGLCSLQPHPPLPMYCPHDPVFLNLFLFPAFGKTAALFHLSASELPDPFAWSALPLLSSWCAPAPPLKPWGLLPEILERDSGPLAVCCRAADADHVPGSVLSALNIFTHLGSQQLQFPFSRTRS